MIGTTARWLMPQLLGAVASRHPRVHPIVSEGSTTTIVPGVLSGQLNAAIIHLPIDDPELEVEPLFAEDLLLLVHSSHPLAERRSMSLTELDDVPLLLPPKGAALRRVLDRAAASVDVTLRAQAEIDGVRLLASLAFDGYGAAIVPATAAPKQIEGDFRRILVPELPRRVVAWVRRRRPGPSAATSAVARTLVEVVRTHADDQPGVHLGTDLLPLRVPATSKGCRRVRADGDR